MQCYGVKPIVRTVEVSAVVGGGEYVPQRVFGSVRAAGGAKAAAPCGAEVKTPKIRPCTEAVLKAGNVASREAASVRRLRSSGY